MNVHAISDQRVYLSSTVRKLFAAEVRLHVAIQKEYILNQQFSSQTGGNSVYSSTAVMLSAEREGVIHIMEQLNTFRKPVRRVDISINMEKTGANIRNLVKASGYSVRDIMTITGISTEQAIYKWYRGESIPALETMLILANALGIELKELLVIDGEFNNYGMCVGLSNEIMGSSGLTKLKSRISRNQWVEMLLDSGPFLVISTIFEVQRQNSGPFTLQRIPLISMASGGNAEYVKTLLKPIWIHTDPVILGRILKNIIDNAITHGCSGKFLGISIKDDKDSVSITIEDHGKGISKENIDHIFERNYTTAARTTGNGLGLAIVAQLAAKLHGKIEVQSISYEKTVFTITLNR